MPCGSTRRFAARNSWAASQPPDPRAQVNLNARARESGYGGQRRQHRVDPGVLTTLETALREVHRPGLLETAWNWRRETALCAGSATAAGVVITLCGPIGLAGLTAAVLVILTALLCGRSTRPWLISWAWWLVTPHRVRAGCVHAWVQNRYGRIPVIVSTTPTRYGQKVRLWLRAGLTVADLETAREVIASACWATEVRVVPNLRYAHLVTLQIIRTPQPDQARPTPLVWPDPRNVTGSGRSDPDTEDRDTAHWLEVPRPRLAGSDAWLRPDAGR